MVSHGVIGHLQNQLMILRYRKRETIYATQRFRDDEKESHKTKVIRQEKYLHSNMSLFKTCSDVSFYN